MSHKFYLFFLKPNTYIIYYLVLNTILSFVPFLSIYADNRKTVEKLNSAEAELRPTYSTERINVMRSANQSNISTTRFP